MADAAEMLSGVNSHWFVVVFAPFLWIATALANGRLALAFS
jgi:hypothetical protein